MIVSPTSLGPTGSAAVRAAEAPRFAGPAALLCIALTLAGCGEGPADRPDAAQATPARAPPAVEFLSGERRTLADFRGSWLFVNYWAEWCAPCLEEIPELNELHEEGGGAFVVGVNFDQLDAKTMRPQVEQLGIRFPVTVADPGAVLGVTMPEVLPSTYVFDPSGAMVAVLRGPQTLEALHGAMEVADVVAAQ
jgi:thiol-disulfide isomerase/thioredoxin